MSRLTGSHILVAGCGYVGSRLARLLVEHGATVYALRRGAAALPVGVTTLRADLIDPLTLRDLPQPLDGVIFAAAPSAHDETAYRRIFVEGLRNLIETLSTHAQPPARMLLTSSTAVYAQSEGEWVDETSPTQPRRFNGEVLLEAESLLHDSAIPGCVVRLGGIYGPGRTRRIERVRAGQVHLRPGAPHYTNRIHRDDAARALMHLLELERVDPLYLGVDGRPADDNEVICFLAEKLGVSRPSPAAENEPAAPRHSGSKRCRNDRLVGTGYRFVYPSYREGYTAMLRGMGD